MNYQTWLQETVAKIQKKELTVVKRNIHKIPYRSIDGRFNDLSEHNPCWWTNGFWGGILWQLYHATKEEIYLEAAEELERKLDVNLMNAEKMDHDSGFKWLPTAIANYKVQGKPESRNRGLLAADNLAGRFNHVGRFIRAWNGGAYKTERTGWAIIDCMMNLPLLYWAYEELEDPRYLQIAAMHADTVMKYFVRADGSVKHIVEFNAATGAYIGSRGGQGYGHGSSWTRGQGWALYGFVLSYIHTKKQQYLDCARKVADYFIDNIPEDGLIPVDFRQPPEPRLEDSTAAAIASCGMIEIARCLTEEEGQKYKNAAIKMLMALEQHHVNWSEDVDHLVGHCGESYHNFRAENSHLIYGDYYFIEAIWKLAGLELFLW